MMRNRIAELVESALQKALANQALAEFVTIYSGSGNSNVRLANGHDVPMNGGHKLEVFANGVARLDAGEEVAHPGKIRQRVPLGLLLSKWPLWSMSIVHALGFACRAAFTSNASLSRPAGVWTQAKCSSARTASAGPRRAGIAAARRVRV